MQLQDKIFQKSLSLVALLAPLLLIGLFVLLGMHSAPIWEQKGIAFVFSSDWNPVMESFGAWPFIQGTLLTALLALFFALPFCLAAALSINLLLPSRVAIVLRSLFDILASVPSIIYGQWALVVLVPIIRDQVSPFLQGNPILGKLPLFQGTSYGLSAFTAAIVLAFMISPLITALMTEIFKLVPVVQRQGFLSLGTTYWEMIRHVYIKPNLQGLTAAASLGLSRALGETMAVAMVIGNFPNESWSVLEPSSTIASVLANEYGEVSDPLHLSALVGLGLILFLITFVLNFIARMILRLRRQV